ncbi:MAG: hypothetical protein RBR82_17330 [Pseudomonas sp.]|nr:hypothetical protein [Pseudomonas sp.]
MKSILGIIAGCILGSFLGPLGLIIGGGIGFIAFSSSVFSSEDNFSSGLDDSFVSSPGDAFSSDVDDPFFSSSGDDFSSGISQINPATGLPMVGDSIGGIDVGGNPYGTDISDSISSGIDDSFGSSFDDSFSSGGINDDW